MRPCPKPMTYRNPRILDAAQFAPYCMCCLQPQEPGTVVACHSNRIAHGHGTGHKAHDIPAYLCPLCHHQVDGRPEGGPLIPREQRERMFLEAVYNTMLWLLDSGHMRKIA